MSIKIQSQILETNLFESKHIFQANTIKHNKRIQLMTFADRIGLILKILDSTNEAFCNKIYSEKFDPFLSSI